jgi:hypothetical protein
MDKEEFPYDWAYIQLGFGQPAIRVASSEGERRGEREAYPWNRAFTASIYDRLDSYHEQIRNSSGARVG